MINPNFLTGLLVLAKRYNKCLLAEKYKKKCQIMS